MPLVYSPPPGEPRLPAQFFMRTMDGEVDEKEIISLPLGMSDDWLQLEVDCWLNWVVVTRQTSKLQSMPQVEKYIDGIKRRPRVYGVNMPDGKVREWVARW